MQGHGYTQPAKQPPSTGVLVLLRVVFVVVSVCSFGMLTWAMLLRLAIVTRKALDWGLLAASIVLEGLGLYLLGSESGDEIHTPGGWFGLVLLLGTLVVGVSYFLAADIRHFQRLPFAGYAPQGPPAGPSYGYPQVQPQPPYPAATVPQSPPPMPHTPVPHTPVPHTPVPAPVPQQPLSTPPPPQRPAPVRIDQVRAELDELSDYLRRHDSRPDGPRDGHPDARPEGGR
ncbi:hypothetical protein ABZT03_18475 [Streptomyces sp. NPDC005574]|uniref:hypothetical protein n=1 Tax=Streptomyces sp. NPDC005574 TaxID=3156891 RepID=UPI0033A16BCD